MLALVLWLSQEAPEQVLAKGRLVCLAEEMAKAHGAAVPPVHEHLMALKLETPKAGLRYYTLLRTPLSEALFRDPRFRDRDLRLSGRVYPGTALLDVQLFQWWTDGELRDVWYWCDVCSIRGTDPGDCACCQAPVELREGPAKN